MRTSLVLPIWSAIFLAVCPGLNNPLTSRAVSAQSSQLQDNASGNGAVENETEQGFLSWLAGRPVGLRLAKARLATVQSVQAERAADQAGLQQGDILLRVGDIDTPSPAQAAEHIDNAWTAGKSAIELVVSRAGQNFYVVLQLHG